MFERLKARWGQYSQACQSSIKRFALNPDVYLVRGARRGAIYDLITGRIYPVSDVATQVLDLAVHQGMTPLKIARQVSIGIVEQVTFLDSLSELRLGYWYEGEARPRSDSPDLNSLTPGVHALSVELTLQCNLQCVHCYAESGPKKSSEELLAREWRQLIDDAAALGCHLITFSGGEPLLAKELLLELIAHAREKELDTRVFTNATLFGADALDSLARFDVGVDISIYGPNEDVHDRVTRTPGSFKAMTKNVMSLKSRGIPVRMDMPVMMENQDYVEETEEFVRDRFNAEFRASVILPVGRGRLNALVSCTDAFLRNVSTKLLQARTKGKVTGAPFQNEPNFPPVHRNDFARQLHKTCWSNALHITPNGDVIPCAAARQLLLGNVRQSKLEAIVTSDAVQRLWRLTSKDRVHVCQNCEYRYACSDCWVRVLAEVGSLYEKPPWCAYDPQAGHWSSENVSMLSSFPRSTMFTCPSRGSKGQL